MFRIPIEGCLTCVYAALSLDLPTEIHKTLDKPYFKKTNRFQCFLHTSKDKGWLEVFD